MSTPAKRLLLVVFSAVVAVVVFVSRPRPPSEPAKPTVKRYQRTSDSLRYSLEEAGERLGVTFTHEPGHPTFFYPEIMGAGCAVADFNGDGRLDILLRGRRPGKRHPYHVPGPSTALFLQRADGTFEDVSADKSGIDDDGYAMGVAVGDVNNDGVPDVYLCNFGQDRLYIGKGDGTFIDVTATALPKLDSFSSSACFVDFDRDGRLDLYATDYAHYTKPFDCQVNGRHDYCHPRAFVGLPHRLLRNVTPPGAGPAQVRFEDVSEKTGIARKAARGLGVILCDVNGDGWPDLYVANDDDANFLWINQKGASFVEAAAAEGVAVSGAGQPQGSMGMVEADLDGDGTLDLAVTNFRAEATTAYCRAPVGFRDRTGALGLTQLTRPFTGFGFVAVDLDCNGVDELIQVNGRVTQLEDARPLLPPPYPSSPESVREFWNAYTERSQVLTRTGARYDDVSEHTGNFGRWIGMGRGLALGDLDGDGRPDLLALDFAERAKVFLNRAEKRGRWISVRALDPAKGNRDMLGATVTVVVGDRKRVGRIRTCGSYQSASEPRAFFGLGDVEKVDRVEIVWPDGDLTPEIFELKKLDVAYTFQRGKGTLKR